MAMTHEEKQEAIKLARLLKNEDFLLLKQICDAKIKSEIKFHAPRGSMQFIAGISEPFRLVEDKERMLQKES